jgi:N-acetylneuraminic acid mutarotase
MSSAIVGGNNSWWLKDSVSIKAEGFMKARQVWLCGIVLCSLILCLSSPCDAGSADGLSLQWTKSTPFPESRAGYAAGVLDGKLVIAGGTYWEGSKGHWVKKQFSASTHAFDPITQVWEELPDLPTPLGYAASVVVVNKLFVLGGYTGTEVSRKIYALAKTPGGYAWTDFGALPVDRLFAGAVSVGRRIYLLGGVTQFEPLDPAGTCCTSKTATNSFMVLDTTHPEKGWSQLAPLPDPRRWGFSTATDGKSIWMFGGTSRPRLQDPSTNYNTLVFRYDIAKVRWEAMKPLPEDNPNVGTPSPVLVKDKIILITGIKKVWQLDLGTLEYTELAPLPEAASVDKFVWLKDRIIGAGGENQIEGPRRRSELTFIGRFGAN